MSTQAQIEANRINAQKSTGPKTEVGKTKVASNALKHGLLAERFAIAEQDRDTFDRFRTQLLDELAPVGQMEALLANRIAILSWRLSLADRAQTSVLYLLTDRIAEEVKDVKKLSPSPSFSFPEQKEEYILGRAFLRDFSNGKVLDRLAAYERRIERSLAATRKELKHLQSLREQPDADSQSSPPAKGEYPRSGGGGMEQKKFDLPTSDSCLLPSDSQISNLKSPLPPQSSFDNRPSSMKTENRQTNPISIMAKSLIPY